MAFVKLDCGILNSSVWAESVLRDTFITALLMAEPYVIDAPVPQLHVRTMAPTGWMVPPGWYGFVPAAGIGIIRRALVNDIEAGLDALERLGSPEPESRSQDFDGRRLVRVDGGYVALNYDRYRERDLSGAERQRRYRLRVKAAKDVGVTLPVIPVIVNQPSPSRNVTSRRKVTQAEEEGEVQRTRTAAPTPPPCGKPVENSEKAKEPSADGNYQVISNVARRLLAQGWWEHRGERWPITTESDLVAGVKDECARLRIDYGNHPDVDTFVVARAVASEWIKTRLKLTQETSEA